MQGATAIRWSSSVLTAITFHTVCWFWVDQFLPPDIATSQPPQRLAITLSKKNTPVISTPVRQETLPHPTLVPAPATATTKSVKQEQTVQSASVALHEPSKPQKTTITNKPKLAPEPIPSTISVRPRWKPEAPARKTVIEAVPQKKDTYFVAAQKSQTSQHTKPIPSPIVKARGSTVKEVVPIATSQTAEKTPPHKTTSPQRQIVASTSPLAAPTFKNLPLVTQPAFSKPPTPPHYPKRAKRKRLQGQVILRARVDKQGLVEHIVIWQSSGHKLLDKAAEKAMWDWQFTPAKQAGIRTASWVEFPVNFAIR